MKSFWKSLGKWSLKLAIWAYGHKDEILVAVDELRKKEDPKVG